MAEPLKNMFSRSFVETLGDQVQTVYSSFDKRAFTNFIFDHAWSQRELKDRMHHISSGLRSHLPEDYRKALGILIHVTKRFRMNNTNVSFTDMVFPDFVEHFGLDDLESSIPALELFTQVSSAEFAVRPFILRYPDIMLQQMLVWSRHSSPHVRRLASEGCRPRLPWAIALPVFQKDPAPILPILENLKADPSEYVRRSVANNLNDITKDNPEIVLQIAERWRGLSTETDKLVKHACRTLLKRGNKKALSIFGTHDASGVSVLSFVSKKKKIFIGDTLDFEAEIRIRKVKTLRIEYAIDFVKSGGKISRKVFKWREGPYDNGSLKLSKRHRFQNFTTRKHYPGKHAITLIINGHPIADLHITLGDRHD